MDLDIKSVRRGRSGFPSPGDARIEQRLISYWFSPINEIVEWFLGRSRMKVIHLRCASLGCRQLLAVAADSRGKLVTCKFCKRVMRVPMEKPGGNGATQPASAPEQAAPATTQS